MQMDGALNTAPGNPLPANLHLFDQKAPSRHLNGNSVEDRVVYVSPKHTIGNGKCSVSWVTRNPGLGNQSGSIGSSSSLEDQQC